MNPSSRVRKTIWISAAVAIIFFAVTLFGVPLEQKFQVSVDEGFNLQRSGLFNQGFQLYSQIASDQPPLFTILLAAVLRGSDNSTAAARVLALLFSTISIFSIAALSGLSTNPKSAWLALPLYFILPWYMHLSTAIMIGLPAIALSAAAVLLYTLWRETRWMGWLVLSAVLMALSIFIKLFTGFIAPMIGSFILYETIRSNSFQLRPFSKWKNVLVWSFTFTLSAALIAISVYGLTNILAALTTHFGGGTQSSFTSVEFALWPHVIKSWLFFVLALPGVIFIIRRRIEAAYPLIAWAVLATIALSFYSPVWAHHQLLITVPLVGIQAIGISLSIVQIKAAISNRKFGVSFGLNTAVVLFSVGMLIGYAPAQVKKLAFDGFPTTTVNLDQMIQTEDERAILTAMRNFSPLTNWVITDMPYYAFAIGKNVPPSLATFSTKMVNSGAITSHQVLKAIEDIQPEQVLLGRITIKQVNNYLAENYTLVYESEIGRLYIRPDLIFGE